MYANIIQVYRTKQGYAIYKNRIALSRVRDKAHALRIARQVYAATKKINSSPVYFDDFTHFISEV